MRMQRMWTYKKKKEAFNRSSYITAVNQRWSGGGNIWQMKARARLSPPMEKDPSSLLCTTRLSMCRVIGEGSESEGFSRGPSSCRRHSTCCRDAAYQRHFVRIRFHKSVPQQAVKEASRKQKGLFFLSLNF